MMREKSGKNRSIESELKKTAGLNNLPTPLEGLKNLSKSYNIKMLYMKRDDKSGLLFGGNKARKLDYYLFHALKEAANVLVTVGSIHSNHAALTVAAGNRFSLSTRLIIIGEDTGILDGNLLLDYFLGAEVNFVTAEKVKNKIDELIEDVLGEGLKPYFIPGGGHSIYGALAYVNCFRELRKQFEDSGEKPGYLVTPVGTGSTLAGLIIGNKIFGWPELKIIGISVSRPRKLCEEIIYDLIQECVQSFNLDINIEKQDINVYDEFIRQGYGLAGQNVVETMKFLAKKEAIILDPVYTGKAFDGMLNLIKRNIFKKEEPIIFLHTGGAPLFFSNRQLYIADKKDSKVRYENGRQV